ERVIAIQLSTHTEDALHGEALESWQHARRSDRSLRQNYGQLVSDFQPQTVGHQPTDDDAELAGAELVQATFDKVVLDDRYRGFLFRQNTVKHHTTNVTTAGDHALPLDEWCGGQNPGVLLNTLIQLLPVGQRAGCALNRGMGDHAENALLELSIKAVHHWQHDNQYRDSQHQANHGRERNKRN